MESVLSLWIEDCRKRDIHLQINVIRKKALNLYAKLVEDDTQDPQPGTSTPPRPGNFQASRGWPELQVCKPQGPQEQNKNALPVYWMHNPKAWITKVIASNWFHRSFIPEVEKYLLNLGFEFMVLLLMNTAEGHPLDLSYDGVQIEFLPSNTTSLIQPMDQGMIREFKALYTRNSLQHLVNAMEMMEDFTLKEYWKKFTIASCLSIIQSALKEMKNETLNTCWEKLWPDAVRDSEGEGFLPEEVHNEAVNKAVRLTKLLGGEGFDDCSEEEVTLIDAHSDPLTDDDLLELTKSASEEGDKSAQEQQEEDEGLLIECLGIIMRTNSSCNPT
ncbi:tigger transposable element-derived protein 1-like [Macrobrachium nipponense]|uniref:tigger transposable element-derived protein 1-like n=1 Tax=Macrobrachium nipponense TaxID=159736 RepID=UPI0030C8320C